MDNYVGKRLDGRYEIQEIIGVGGMSVVYKAYDNVDDRIVAVKILKDEFLTNDDFVRRFKNESKAIALLSHPNIVKVYDVSFGEKLQYIVMEYVDGITLKEYIQKQNSITWNDALFFVTQILKALQHAHDKGIVHRDIKPQNIILLADGSIKVADFGIARFSRSDTKTLTDTAIGSVHYISPEQAKGEFTDEKADIYSLGVVLYEMLAGKVPFEADSAVSVALMQLQNDAKKLTEINPDIPLGLEQICIHAMQKDPKERYQTATEMLLDVEEIIKNPETVFDYSYYVDEDPTRYVIKTEDNQVNDYQDDDEEYYDEDDYYDPKHKVKVRVAVIIGVIVLIGAAVALVFSFTGNFNTKTNVLDNFVGMSYDEILSSNEYKTKYTFIQITEKSDEFAPGIVIRQEPEAGTKVTQGSEVKLIVAIANSDLKMPNLYGVSQEKAEKALNDQGFTNYKVSMMASETIEEGKVVSTQPKAESVITADEPIILYISSGPSTVAVETINMPDVSGLSKEGARAFLEKLGFTNINFVEENSTLPKNIVIAQSPAAGGVATADETIKITISNGETTTQKNTSDVYLSVILPSIPNTTDILVIEIDGKVYTNNDVSNMDGSTIKKTLHITGTNDVNVRVSLKSTGAVDTKTITPNPKQDQSVTIDFSSYSVSNPAPSTTAPVTNN